jgi:hypothetical protein
MTLMWAGDQTDFAMGDKLFLSPFAMEAGAASPPFCNVLRGGWSGLFILWLLFQSLKSLRRKGCSRKGPPASQARYFWLKRGINSIEDPLAGDSTTCCGVNLAFRYRGSSLPCFAALDLRR